MNFSKVYRNSSGDRFKVRREKGCSNQASLISAQKVVLQEKEKREKKELERSFHERPASRDKKKKEVSKPVPRSRYF